MKMGWRRRSLGLLLLTCYVNTNAIFLPPELYGKSNVVGDENGGTDCAVCSILLGMVEQLADVYNRTIEQELEVVCNLLEKKKPQRIACDLAVRKYTAQIIDGFDRKDTSDVICHGIGLCKNETAYCHLFPSPPKENPLELERRVKRAQADARRRGLYHTGKIDWCSLPGIKDLCNFANDHLPVEDLDGDRFSFYEQLRGSNWRGRDCNDADAKVYPGRNARGDDFLFDSNCNGIYGIDAASGKTYEELWCNNTEQMGVLLMGDSAGAHFHLPPAWFTATEISPEALAPLAQILENEIDWPMFSAVTGYENITQHNGFGLIAGPVDSIYLRLRELNRCNHRDYQNIGLNGARSSAVSGGDNATDHGIGQWFARDHKHDQPLLIVHELMGNDVCSSHKTFDTMTSPQKFAEYQKKTLLYIDSRVPSGSKVVMTGTVDGRTLYNSMHDKIHPLGRLRNDVTYRNVYDFLNCLQISPCWGWMNSDEATRNKTTAIGVQQDQALQAIITELNNSNAFRNIEVLYIPPLFDEIMALAAQHGYEHWELIEPVDGFHPNQIGNYYEVPVVWDYIQKHAPGFIPNRNPYNHAIIQEFGGQGGY